MVIDNTFDFKIPTHISFTLYKYNHIDSIIISNVLRECKNYSTNESSRYHYTVKTEDFKNAINLSARLKAEVKKAIDFNQNKPLNVKYNSIIFLWIIFERLSNLEWLTFDISFDQKFSRVINIENKKLLNFNFKIEEGIFNLADVFNRRDIDEINKKFINAGIMDNKYLTRYSYFYLKTSYFFDVLSELAVDNVIDAFSVLDKIDPKLEEDDPVLLVITDYSSY